MRLYFHTHEAYGTSQVLIQRKEPSNPTSSSPPGPVAEVELGRQELNERLFNITFSERPIQCERDVCQVMAKMIQFGPRFSSQEVNLHKYAFDLDGNGWSGRFHRLLWTKHLVVKSTVVPEWFADRIQAWYHYVPSQVDYTDLYGIVNFFSGGIDGSEAHEKMAERIAEQGREFAQKHWRRVDMAAYMYRVVLEWIRLYNRAEDGTSADFEEEL